MVCHRLWAGRLPALGRYGTSIDEGQGLAQAGLRDTLTCLRSSFLPTLFIWRVKEMGTRMHSHG